MSADNDDARDDSPAMRLVEEMAGIAAVGQKALLGVMAAEFKALTSLGAALGTEGETEAEAEARHAAEDAEVEAGFDNMPV